MKYLILNMIFIVGNYVAHSQNIAINTDSSLPDSSAQLDIKSNLRGLLIPRMTENEKSNISKPAKGLIIYQIGGSEGFYYNKGNLNSPYWVKIQDTLINYQNSLDTKSSKKTFYIVASGQSNLTGAAQDEIGDTLSDSRVLVWDWNQQLWHILYVGQSPLSTISPTNNSPMHIWYFARKYARLTGDTVRIVFNSQGSTTISEWFSGSTKGKLLDTLINRCIKAKIPQTDLFIWDQGESDNSTPAMIYNQSWDSIKSTLRKQQFFTNTTPIVVVGMPQVSMGCPPGYQGQDPNLRSFDYNNDILDGYASTDFAQTNNTGGNPVHFNSSGLKQIGEVGIWNAWKALPNRYFDKNNPGGVNNSSISPTYVDINHNDPATTGARNSGLTLRNSSSTGYTGISLYSNDSSLIGSLHIPNKSANYLGSNNFVIGTETDGDVMLMRNFKEYVRLLNNSISITQKTNFTNNVSITGSLSTSFISTSINYTPKQSDQTIETTKDGITITLPPANGNLGRIITIKNTSIGIVTVQTSISELIDDSNNYILSSKNKYLTIQSNNNKWLILGNN